LHYKHGSYKQVVTTVTVGNPDSVDGGKVGDSVRYSLL
jgi:hypothetical protein